MSDLLTNLQITSVFIKTAKLIANQLINLTAWNRISEKLIGPQVVKKFPAFYGTKNFVTAFTRTRHLSLS